MDVIMHISQVVLGLNPQYSSQTNFLSAWFSEMYSKLYYTLLLILSNSGSEASVMEGEQGATIYSHELPVYAN